MIIELFWQTISPFKSLQQIILHFRRTLSRERYSSGKWRVAVSLFRYRVANIKKDLSIRVTRICRNTPAFFVAMENDKTCRAHELRPRFRLENVAYGNKRAVHYSADARLAEHVKLGTGRSARRILRPGMLFARSRLESRLQIAQDNASWREPRSWGVTDFWRISSFIFQMLWRKLLSTLTYLSMCQKSVAKGESCTILLHQKVPDIKSCRLKINEVVIRNDLKYRPQYL